jgi:hypothetical protein
MDCRQWAGLQTYNHHQHLVERLFDVQVLDPAMGSGHFLVQVVDFVTDRVLNFLNQFPVNPVNFALERTRTSIIESLSAQGVTADPARLTDINLLKRQVLKRCIYGVDINPMAVELAKVSLWLDAFTLGAPLNFLDHHLRCGNSLIGATFEDLVGETKDSMFSVDYEPMLRAVNGVLLIGRLADATSAEVASSAAHFAEARRQLQGYRIALDAVAARSFGVERADKLATLAGVELSERERDLAQFFPSRREELPRIEELANEHRFFHWEIEFPEVFFGYISEHRRQIRHKNEIHAGSAGFDCVIGNPPYVRMELIKPLKPFLKAHYRCHAERADLFIYFYEKALNLLRTEGRTAFIASSTWTRTKAGEGLRVFLQREATLHSFIDFGDLPVFEDATTYPCILVTERGTAPRDHTVASTVVPDLLQTDLSAVLTRSRVEVPQVELEIGGWYFEDRAKSRLREKLRAAGIPLKEYCGSPLYGIKTGLNEAFVIDSPTRDRLVAEDPRSSEMLKPFLEGKDLKAWHYEWRGLWLIYAYHGVDIKRYPAILSYLKTFRPRLEERATIHSHHWHELQQPQMAYSAAYAKPKIFYPHFSRWPKFSFDPKGFFGNDKTYCIPGEDWYLLGLLNSHALWYMITQTCPAMRGGLWRYELRVQYVDRLPIRTPSDMDRGRIAELARQLALETVSDRSGLENELNDRVAHIYDLTREEQAIVNDLGKRFLPIQVSEDA